MRAESSHELIVQVRKKGVRHHVFAGAPLPCVSVGAIGERRLRCKKRIANLRFGPSVRDVGDAKASACTESADPGRDWSEYSLLDPRVSALGMSRSRSMELRRDTRPLSDVVDQLRERSALQFSELLRLSVPAGTVSS